MDIYRLKVTLRHIRPPIWRRIEVPADIRLGRLHHVLQDAMGWSDSHLHAFRVGDANFGVPDPDFPAGLRSERNVRLDRIAGEGARFVYEYDFGDGWKHDILVEKILPAEPGARYPRCLAGRRACPPEDCGGPPGYERLLDILRRGARTDDEADLLDWLPDDFDPETFDPDEINELLRDATRR